MKLNMPPILSMLFLFGLLIASLCAGRVHADELNHTSTGDPLGSAISSERSTVNVTVKPGESLSDVIKRVQPCKKKVNESDSEDLDQILAWNPEQLDSHGVFVLSHDTVKLPSGFVQDPKTCDSVQSLPVKTAVIAAPLIKEENPPLATQIHANADPAKPSEEKKAESRKPSSAEMNPAAPEVEEKEGEEHPSIELHVGTFLESSQLHTTDLATGTQTTLDSKPEYGVELSAYKAVTDHFFLGVNYKVAKTGFNDLDGVELHESFTSMSEVSVGMAYKPSEVSIFSLNVGKAQTDHITLMPDDNAIQVDAVWLTKISA